MGQRGSRRLQVKGGSSGKRSYGSTRSKKDGDVGKSSGNKDSKSNDASKDDEDKGNWGQDGAGCWVMGSERWCEDQSGNWVKDGLSSSSNSKQMTKDDASAGNLKGDMKGD